MFFYWYVLIIIEWKVQSVPCGWTTNKASENHPIRRLWRINIAILNLVHGLQLQHDAKFWRSVRLLSSQYLFGRISRQTIVFWQRQPNHHFEIDITYANINSVNKSWLSCSQGDLLLREQNFAVNCENQCTILRMIQ